jgi:hypothetical protein
VSEIGNGSLDRREFIRKAARTGVATVWAAPLLTTVTAAPAFAQAYPEGKDFSYIAVCYSCDGGASRCCVKLDLNDQGFAQSCEEDDFETKKCESFFPDTKADTFDHDCGNCGYVTIVPVDGAKAVTVVFTDPAPASCIFLNGPDRPAVAVGKCGNPPATGACVLGVLAADRRSVHFALCPA